MANWEFLNKHRIVQWLYSTPEDGFNGAFGFNLPGEARKIFCLASDGLGWQHVSVSFGEANLKTPSWEVMSKVKDLFWEPTDWVVQFHPPVSEYVNFHPGCLHLWRCTDGRQQPTPLAIMVGPIVTGGARIIEASAPNQ